MVPLGDQSVCKSGGLFCSSVANLRSLSKSRVLRFLTAVAAAVAAAAVAGNVVGMFESLERVAPRVR